MRRFFIFIIFGVISLTCFSQTLKKILKTNPNTSELKIVGAMDEFNLATIYKFKNLKTLDISEAQMTSVSSVLSDIANAYHRTNAMSSSPAVGYNGHSNTIFLRPDMSIKVLKISSNQRIAISEGGELELTDLYYKGGSLPQEHIDGNLVYFTPRLKFHNLHWDLTSEDLRLEDETVLGKKYANLFSRLSPIKIDTLFIENKDWIRCTAILMCNPECITFGDSTTMLVEYRMSDKNVDLSQYDYIAPDAFANSSIESVTFGNKIKAIPDRCFYNCKSLVSMDGLENIEQIGAEAFYSVSIDSMCFSDKLTSINGYSFYGSNISSIEFKSQYAPFIENYSKELENIVFYIPRGTQKTFQIGNWNELNVLEKDVNTSYRFEIKEPGTLGNFINKGNAHSIQILTISGILDTSDFAYIRMCKNLRVLDLSHCFTTKSADQINETNALLGLFEVALNESDKEYEELYELGLINDIDAIESEITSSAIRAMIDESKDNNANSSNKCHIDENALNGLKYLQEIRFPTQMEVLNVQIPPSVKKIVLPSRVKKLGGIQSCILNELILPETLEEIYPDCFSKSRIKLLDMSKTKVTDFSSGSFSGTVVDVLKAPVNLKSISYSGLEFDDEHIKSCYFYSVEQPYGFELPDDYMNCHIRKGVKAGWEYRNLVDDIQ